MVTMMKGVEEDEAAGQNGGVGLVRETCSGIPPDIKYSSNVKLTTEYCTICQQIV